VKNILIINAHQFYPSSEGKLNKSMVQLAKDFFEKAGHQVKQTTIDNGYNIKEEAEKHEWADLVITQMPVYWVAGPWSYKKYIDEVFNELIARKNIVNSDGRSRYHDKQYGTGGFDHGKKFLLSSTWNAPDIAFGDKNQFLFEGRDLNDALIVITSVYKFNGFEILDVFACFDVMKAPQIENDFKRYNERLANIF
jgi:modulator of drug activity B